MDSLIEMQITLSPAMHRDLAVTAERYGLTLEEFTIILLSGKVNHHIATEKVETYAEFLNRMEPDPHE